MQKETSILVAETSSAVSMLMDSFPRQHSSSATSTPATAPRQQQPPPQQQQQPPQQQQQSSTSVINSASSSIAKASSSSSSGGTIVTSSGTTAAAPPKASTPKSAAGGGPAAVASAAAAALTPTRIVRRENVSGGVSPALTSSIGAPPPSPLLAPVICGPSQRRSPEESTTTPIMTLRGQHAAAASISSTPAVTSSSGSNAAAPPPTSPAGALCADDATDEAAVDREDDIAAEAAVGCYELWENQRRFFPFQDFSAANRFPGDRPATSNRKGDRSRHMAAFVLPPGAAWSQSTWDIDTSRIVEASSDDAVSYVGPSLPADGPFDDTRSVTALRATTTSRTAIFGGGSAAPISMVPTPDRDYVSLPEFYHDHGWRFAADYRVSSRSCSSSPSVTSFVRRRRWFREFRVAMPGDVVLWKEVVFYGVLPVTGASGIQATRLLQLGGSGTTSSTGVTGGTAGGGGGISSSDMTLAASNHDIQREMERQHTAMSQLLSPWTQFCERQNTGDGKGSLQCSLEMRALIYDHGLPYCLRGPMWLALSGATAQRQCLPTQYAEVVSTLPAVFGDALVDPRSEVNIDVLRTLTGHPLFESGRGPGSVHLRDLLYAFMTSDAQPYHQSYSYVAAALLLNVDHPQDAYWLFRSLVKEICPVGYFDGYLISSDITLIGDVILERLSPAQRLRVMGPDCRYEPRRYGATAARRTPSAGSGSVVSSSAGGGGSPTPLTGGASRGASPASAFSPTEPPPAAAAAAASSSLSSSRPAATEPHPLELYLVFAHGWLQALCCAHFPISTTCRFLDILFAEGHTLFLLRLIIAFFMEHANALLEEPTMAGLVANSWSRGLYDPSAIIKAVKSDGLDTLLLARRRDVLQEHMLER